MEKLMEWMKTLGKRWGYVLQAIIIIIMFIMLIISCNGTGDSSGTTIGKEITSLREQLVILEGQNKSAIESLANVVDSNERITSGLKDIQTENQRARDIATELSDINVEHTSGIREVQDTIIESEFITDGIRQLIRSIESENNYN